MKAPQALIIATTTGVLLATSLVLPAIASQPKGSIKKLVQNQTTNSKSEDADSAGQALPVKTGDILKYTIEVTNGGDSPMQSTRLTDTLPAGVELVRDTASRQISQDLGTINPGKTETRTFIVRVTSEKMDDTIENKACFTSDKANAQNGCDSAFIKVTAVQPMKPKASTTPQAENNKPNEQKSQPQPQQPANKSETTKEAPKKEEGKKPEEGKKAEEQAPGKQQQPTAPSGGKENLPTTGPATALAPALAVGTGVLGYVGRLVIIKRKRA